MDSHLRDSRFGRFLLALGVVVGAIASLAYIVGARPSQLPDLILDTAVYKLLFIAALGLIGAGALVVRYGRQRREVGQPRSPQPLGAGPVDASGKPAARVPVHEPATPA